MNNRLTMVILLVMVFLLAFPSEIFANSETLPSGIKDSEIARVIEDYIEENKGTTSSVSLAIFRGDETIYKTEYGYANIEEGVKADEETVYEWGSVGKLLVWVSVMQLWEDGKIDLETDVKEYLPQDFIDKLNYDQAITMINLMNHNAGFEDTIFQMCAEDENSVLELGEALKLTEPEQIYKPGTVVSYSNWTTALAGYIVEQISGQAFYQYVQENIFKSLDMKHTALEPRYFDNPWVKERLLESNGYTSELEPMDGGLFYINLYPAGSVAGTLDDFLKFAKSLLPNSSDDKKLFKNKETFKEMLLPTLKYPNTEIDYINHGFWSHEFSLQALGHGGNTSMYSSYLLIDPLTGVGTVIMTNQGGEITYNHGIPPMIFGKTGEMAITGEISDASKIQGLYYSARTIRNGIGKMYSILGILPYLDDGQGNLNSNFFGLAQLTSNQIAPNTFLTSREIGSLEMDSIERYSNNNGVNRLSSLYAETLEADTDIWILTITTILFIIAALWSLVLLIINFISFIMQITMKRKKSYDGFKKFEIILNISILLLIYNIVSVGNKMLSLIALPSSLIINIIVSIVLGFIPIVYSILLFNKWRKLTSSRWQKISYIISMSMGFVMTLTVLVLEMYKL